MPIKIDANNMEVEKIEPAVKRKITYSLDFLLSQKVSIQAQKDRDNIARDKELAEVNSLIAEANLLGLKTLAEIEALKPKPVIV